MAELTFKEITEQIIGASYEVHTFMGNGFQACLPEGSSARRQVGKASPLNDLCYENKIREILPVVIGINCPVRDCLSVETMTPTANHCAVRYNI